MPSRRKKNRKSKNISTVKEKINLSSTIESFDAPQSEVCLPIFDIAQPLYTSEQLKNTITPLECLQKAAEVHRQSRKWLLSWLKPGMNLLAVADAVEDRVRQLVGYQESNPLQAGNGFPTGLSLNNCGAHWTPNIGDTTLLKADDIMKIDYGVQINGYIIDSAFTHSFNSKYDPLIQASSEATDMGIKLSGDDASLSEIGAGIQEVLESFEVEIDGKTRSIRATSDLCGHGIGRYQIHAGKAVPNVKIPYPARMKAGEIYAIETFASTGKGKYYHQGENSHLMIDPKQYSQAQTLSGENKKLYTSLMKEYFTLPFAKKWMERSLEGEIKNINNSLQNLVTQGLVKEYPPLCDVKGSYVSQKEHTIYIKKSGVEIVSQGDDY